jgi:hypothetical protein
MWPPSVQEYYLLPDFARPLFQGDVFEDVPFVKARAGNSPDSEPHLSLERRLVCTLLYPCDMYTPDGLLARVQAVAVVREQSKGDNLPPNWKGAFNLFPYPSLGTYGRMYVADFRTTANVDRSYLRPEKRIASLSLLAWSFFRQRIALNYTRSEIDLGRLIENGRETWKELELWQEWSRRLEATDGFQIWYNTPSPELEDLTPRAMVNEQGHFARVQQLMKAEIGRRVRGT